MSAAISSARSSSSRASAPAASPRRLALELLAARVARREGHDEVVAQQRRVRVAEDARTSVTASAPDRLAVVAALERHEAVLAGPPAVGPVVERHLERDLRGRGAVGGEERVAEPAGRERREPLGELDHRLVREAREHHVLERAQLVGDAPR